MEAPKQKYPKDKQLAKVMKQLVAQGWKVEQTQGNHWKCTPPAVEIAAIVTGGTPSDHKALKNFLASLRRAGWEDPTKKAKKKAKPVAEEEATE